MENFSSSTHFLYTFFNVVILFVCQDDSSKGMSSSARAGRIDSSTHAQHVLGVRSFCFKSLYCVFAVVVIVAVKPGFHRNKRRKHKHK